MIRDKYPSCKNLTSWIGYSDFHKSVIQIFLHFKFKVSFLFFFMNLTAKHGSMSAPSANGFLFSFRFFTFILFKFLLILSEKV